VTLIVLMLRIVRGGKVRMKYHRRSFSQRISCDGITVMSTHDSYNKHLHLLSYLLWTATNRKHFQAFPSHLNDDGGGS
jgi:hypothetical protein